MFTNTGKTELAKQVAKYIHKDNEKVRNNKLLQQSLLSIRDSYDWICLNIRRSMRLVAINLSHSSLFVTGSQTDRSSSWLCWL